MFAEEALQIAEKRREVKGKGEKERHSHLNAEFQRIAKRNKEAFLSEQCKEIQENNRMGKTRDLLKKKKCEKEKWLLRRPYKQLRKVEKPKAKDKRKDIPI